MSKAVLEFALKCIVGLAGLSLSVNSFLIQGKLSDMSTDLKALASAVQGLQVSTALAQQQINTLQVRDDQLYSQVDRVGERLREAEELCARLRAELDRPR